MNRRLAIGGALAVLALVSLAFLGQALGPATRARFPSSLAGEPEGLLAFRRLLESEKIEASVLNGPWDELHPAGGRGLLIVATPLQRSVDDRDIDGLRRWLRAGGSLLVVDDATTLERPPRLDEFLEEAGLDALPPIAIPDPGTLMPARPDLTVAGGAPVRGAGADLRRLMLHVNGGVLPGGSAVPLAVTTTGQVVAAEASYGSGRMVRVQGPLLANDKLLEGDGLRFSLRLVDDLRGNGPVLFDEYHHGFGGLFPAAARDLDRRALLLAGAQILAAVCLYLLARGVRFGPPRLAPRPLRRSGLEFVQSMASLYRRAGAGRHVLDVSLERIAREARARYGLDEALPPAEIGRIVASRAGLDPRRLERLLASADEARYRKTLPLREMLERARELASVESELFGPGRTPL